MQIFRDDTRRRWRRLQIMFGVAIVVCAAVVFAFVKTLRPRPAAILAPPPETPTSNLEDVKTRAMQAAHADPRKAIDVTAGVAAIAPAKGAAVQGKGGGPAPIGETFVTRIGFVDATEEEALHSLQAHGSQLTHVAIEGLHVRDAQGGILGQLPDAALAAAKDEKLKLLEVVDDVREDVNHPADVTIMGKNPVIARKFAASLQAKLAADGANGVLLDLGEDDADPDGAARAALLAEVFATLEPAGFVVGVRVDARFVPEALAKQAKIADLVVVRAFAGLDPKSSPAPLAPRAWMEKTIDAAAQIVPSHKLVIAIATRAGAWPVDAKLQPVDAARELQWAEVMARARIAHVKPTWDRGTGNLVVALPGRTGIQSSPYVRAVPNDGVDDALVSWFADGATFADALSAIHARGLHAFATGNLGGEDPRVWSVTKAYMESDDDREAIRAALVEIPHPTEPDVVGDGVAMTVDMSERDGATSIDFGVGGRIETESYDTIPAAPTVIRRGKVPHKTVVLTFDDGPTKQYTPRILDTLAQLDVHATFFAVGAQAEREPEILRREIAEGHEIGNHSFSHPDLGKIGPLEADLEINSTNRLFEALTGRSTVLFRPPFRSDDRPTVTEDLLAIENGERNAMITVTSNVDPHDWARPEPDVMVDYLVRRVEKFDGAVILMHDGGGDRENTVRTIKPLVETLRARGYRFAQLHEVFGETGVDVVNPPVAKQMDLRIGEAIWWGGAWFLRGMTGLAIFALALGLFRFAALGIGALIEKTYEWRERRAIRRTSRLPNRNAVSVVIPAFNEAKVIERTILSVLASRGVEVEVLVVDDGSTDDTADVVSQAFYFEPRVKLIRLENGGKARALNVGFERAMHDVVVALDADTIFLPDTIVELARKFDDPRVAAVAGRAAVGNTQHFVSRWQAVEYVLGQAIERRAWALLGVVSVVPGAVGAWHRDAVLEVGGFGTDTLAEDCDLCITLQVNGYRVAYAPDAVALTEAPENVRALLKQRFRWCFGVLQTMWKHKWAMLRPPKDNPVVGLLLMPAIFLCHLGTPLLAPIADVAALLAIGLGHGKAILPYFVGLVAAELLLTVLAFRLDRARITLLWDWLVNRSVYRWLLFVALCRAVVAALRGASVGWGKLVRTGTVKAPGTLVATAGESEKVTA